MRFDSSPPESVLETADCGGEEMPGEPRAKLYLYHVENLRSLEKALRETAHLAANAIRDENEKKLTSLNRLYAFLIGAWAECRLQKLLFEDNAYAKTVRQNINISSTQIDQWLYLAEHSFRLHYGIPAQPVDASSVGAQAADRYMKIRSFLDLDLRVIIEVRNKIAHGQWVYPLNSAGDRLSQTKYTLLSNENLLSLQLKQQMILHIGDLVHDLLVSKPTFDRDFEKRYSRLTNAKNGLSYRSYSKFVSVQKGKKTKLRHLSFGEQCRRRMKRLMKSL